MNTVVLESISRSFGSFAAVSNFSLEIAEGEFVTLLGASGCGKTTTLRMVAGLETNDMGKIAIRDTVVSDPSKGVFVAPEKRGIGMVFQSYAIWPHMTVKENVGYPLSVRHRPKAEIDQAVREALSLVEMEQFGDRPAPALSGGQQQRVAIARALVAKPSLLLLDEPLSNLDARLRKQMGDDLRELQRKTGVTALYVTHDQDEAMALSDRVVVMHGGKMLQDGPPHEIYRHPKSTEVAHFFGAPNIFPSVVLGASVDGTGRNVLRVRNATWEGECLSPKPVAEGTEVDVMVRNEDVLIHNPHTHEVGLSFSGIIRHSTFRGATQSLVVDTAGGDVSVEATSLYPVTVGDTVNLTAARDAAWAIIRRTGA